MSSSAITPEDFVGMALRAAREGDPAVFAALDELPAPIYVTDADGWIRYYNRACVGFSGHAPKIGEARWCVSWRLFTQDGAPLDHDACPMAVALREGKAVRGVVALAERPDGTRVMFAPYPTPLIDEDGHVSGAINILIDVTDHRQAGELRLQAIRCRRLAHAMTDQKAIDTLLLMAREYDEKAAALPRAN
jgi:PAS domain S-box-containing protein